MKIKTSELTGAALDWAVAKCEYDDLAAACIQYPEHAKFYPKVSPSTDWAQGGPIIEREKLDVMFEGPEWYAYMRWEDKTLQYDGPTPLIAAMRCFVASKLGDTVDIPEELR